MTVEVPALTPDALQDAARGESSASVRARVVTTRERQRQRYDGTSVRTNAELTSALLSVHAEMNAACRHVMSAAMKRLALSARGYDRVRRVTRTIADLASGRARRAKRRTIELSTSSRGRSKAHRRTRRSGPRGVWRMWPASLMPPRRVPGSARDDSSRWLSGRAERSA